VAVTTYSTKADLRIGDLRLPTRMGDGTGFVEAAAEEIDAQLGHIYKTPLEIDPNVPSNRPAILLLKNMNNLIASGRLVLDLAASSEDDSLHAYGRSMLQEGLTLLRMIQQRDILLTGAEQIVSSEGDKNLTGPMILNEDPVSLVEGFYNPPYSIAPGFRFPRPYGAVTPP
jgi:hypothetical protein